MKQKHLTQLRKRYGHFLGVLLFHQKLQLLMQQMHHLWQNL